MSHDPRTDDPVALEKQARAILRQSTVSSGCSGMMLLCVLGLTMIFAIGLVMAVSFLFEVQALVMGVVCAVLLGLLAICAAALWFSSRSLDLSLKQARSSRAYIRDISERREAQQGSLSISQEVHQGDLSLSAAHHGALSLEARDASTRVREEGEDARQFDFSQEEERASEEAEASVAKRKNG